MHYLVVLLKNLKLNFLPFSGLFFHVVGEGVVNLSRKAENFTDKENYIDFRLRLLGEPGKKTLCTLLSFSKLHCCCCCTIVKENWSIVVIWKCKKGQRTNYLTRQLFIRQLSLVWNWLWNWLPSSGKWLIWLCVLL